MTIVSFLFRQVGASAKMSRGMVIPNQAMVAHSKATEEPFAGELLNFDTLIEQRIYAVNVVTTVIHAFTAIF